MLTWQDVVDLARELPEVEESTSYGRPALKVRGKFVAALRSDPAAVVVRCDLDEKPLLLEARPETLFETPHYHGWGYILVRLEASRDDMREFLTDSWLLAAPKKLAASISLD
ncbi:MAG TPA: MmcQ/YjbR family DNA-binding protein [Gaiellaceae bacterium]|nr:MmcQ/YjbR family DNA-binding protein [Gaiellaceae bacterium]